MKSGKRSLFWLPVTVSILMSASIASAEFVPIEDFENLELGPIHEQNGWRAPSDESIVALDPDGGDNQVLSVSTESTYLFRELLLLNGTVRMLFLRFRCDDQLNFSLGLSDQIAPTRFDYFEPELSVTNSTNELRINDDGMYDILTVLEYGIWYNCWMLINNITDDTQVWLHTRPAQAATFGDLLSSDGQTVFEFRDGAAADLLNFFIKTGGGSGPSGPLYIDDIHLESGDAVNLSNPVDVVAAVRTAAVPASPEPAHCYPNPFNPSTHISFGLPVERHVLLTVHAVDGSRVATLVDGSLPGGRHEILWNGCGDHGRPAASGTYFYRLEAGAHQEIGHMSLIK